MKLEKRTIVTLYRVVLEGRAILYDSPAPGCEDTIETWKNESVWYSSRNVAVTAKDALVQKHLDGEYEHVRVRNLPMFSRWRRLPDPKGLCLRAGVRKYKYMITSGVLESRDDLFYAGIRKVSINVIKKDVELSDILQKNNLFEYDGVRIE